MVRFRAPLPCRPSSMMPLASSCPPCRAAMRGSVAAARAFRRRSSSSQSSPTTRGRGQDPCANGKASGVPVPLTLLSPYRDIASVILQYDARGADRACPPRYRQMPHAAVPRHSLVGKASCTIESTCVCAPRSSAFGDPSRSCWRLGGDDVVEGRQRVNDPFLRAARPVDRVRQPGTTRGVPRERMSPRPSRHRPSPATSSAPTQPREGSR